MNETDLDILAERVVCSRDDTVEAGACDRRRRRLARFGALVTVSRAQLRLGSHRVRHFAIDGVVGGRRCEIEKVRGIEMPKPGSAARIGRRAEKIGRRELAGWRGGRQREGSR